MPLWYPRWRLRDTDSVEPDDINENLKELYDAMDWLNEDNFETLAISVPETVVGAVYIVQQAVFEDSTVMYNGNAAPAYTPPRDGLWHTVGDDATPWTLDIQDSPGGDLVIFASFQIQNTESYNEDVFDTRVAIALAVDGQIIWETMTGSLEPQQNLYHCGDDTIPERTKILGDDVSLIMISQPVCPEITVPIAPGDHTVSVLIRIPTRIDVPAAFGDNGPTGSLRCVKNGEITAITMVN